MAWATWQIAPHLLCVGTLVHGKGHPKVSKLACTGKLQHFILPDPLYSIACTAQGCGQSSSPGQANCSMASTHNKIHSHCTIETMSQPFHFAWATVSGPFFVTAHSSHKPASTSILPTWSHWVLIWLLVEISACLAMLYLQHALLFLAGPSASTSPSPSPSVSPSLSDSPLASPSVFVPEHTWQDCSSGMAEVEW